MIGTRFILSLSLLTSLAWTQATTPAPSQQPPAHPARSRPPAAAKPGSAPSQKAAKAVPPSAPVITIQGLCSTPPPARKTAAARKPAAGCETVVTRADWEKVMQMVRPNLPPAQRLPLAQQYAQLLVISDAGRKAGIEKDPDVQEELRLSRMQIVVNSYTRRLQKQVSDVPPAEMEKYYKANPSQFVEATLLRIYIPKSMGEDGKPADEAAGKALAEKIRERAAAGEDFEKLQKDAYAQANNKGTPPAVDMGERRRGTLPPKHEGNVFDLKPGEVSPVYEEPSGDYIYKLVSKGTVPLEKVKDEIKAAVARDKFREAMEKLRDSVKIAFDDAYFTPPTPPPAPHAAPGAPPVPSGTPGQAPPNAPSATPPPNPAAHPPAAPPSAPEPPKTQPPPSQPPQ